MGGIAWPLAADKPYARLKPADHTGPCWAGAIGGARHAGLPAGEPAALWALKDLANGGECICGKRQTRRSRRH